MCPHQHMFQSFYNSYIPTGWYQNPNRGHIWNKYNMHLWRMHSYLMLTFVCNQIKKSTYFSSELGFRSSQGIPPMYALFKENTLKQAHHMSRQRIDLAFSYIFFHCILNIPDLKNLTSMPFELLSVLLPYTSV